MTWPFTILVRFILRILSQQSAAGLVHIQDGIGVPPEDRGRTCLLDLSLHRSLHSRGLFLAGDHAEQIAAREQAGDSERNCLFRHHFQGGKAPVVHLLIAAGQIQGYTFDSLWVLKEGGMGIVKGDVSIFPNSQTDDVHRKAAEQGHPRAQYNLGVLYANGQGVPQDFTEAAKWFRKAAEQGYAPAQNNLGSLYDKGKGVPLDFAEAAKWYRKAAEQGDADAAEALEQLQDAE